MKKGYFLGGELTATQIAQVTIEGSVIHVKTRDLTREVDNQPIQTL